MKSQFKMPSNNRESYANQSFNKKSNSNSVLKLAWEITAFLLKLCWLVVEPAFRFVVPAPLKPVKGEIVLITGAGSGIGRQLALHYASEGAVVVCWDVNEKGNLGTVKEIERLGHSKAHAYVCDVSNRQEVMDTAARVQREVGDVTILVNNAGIMPFRPVLEQTADEINRTMDINAKAHFWTVQAFVPAMKKNNHGHIVAVSSVAGLQGGQNLVPYCASKHAVRGFMDALLYDLRVDPKCRIKTTTVYPFAIQTGLYDTGRIRMKFPSLFPFLDCKYAARCIMNAQRRDLIETSIPRHLLVSAYYFRLLPAKAFVHIIQFSDSTIEPY